jgi:hypothetical protein
MSFPTSTPTSFPTPPVAYPSYPAWPHLSSSVPRGGPVGRKNRGRLAPLGGVEGPRHMVRFARFIQRRVRVLGGPAVRAAFGGTLSLTWLPLQVVAAPAVILLEVSRERVYPAQAWTLGGMKQLSAFTLPISSAHHMHG